MNPFVQILTGLFGGANNPISTLIDRLVPDKAAAEKAKLELQEKVMEWAAQQDVSQIQVNQEEAKSSSVFVAGWRPAIGWICGAALGWTYVAQPLLGWIVTTVCTLKHIAVPVLPTLDLGELMPLLMGMLGLAGMRSFEKVQGVARSNLSETDKK